MDAKELKVLSDEAFKALTTAEKVEYLRKAVEARALIDRQLNEMLRELAPVIRKDGQD
jgi:hypothetical protein